MSTELTVLFACVFLAAIPFNLYVVREFRGYASIRPYIPSLTLLSRLVSILAYAATVISLISFTSAVLLTTSARLLPTPLPLVLLITVLLAVSFANLLALGYLRRMRGD